MRFVFSVCILLILSVGIQAAEYYVKVAALQQKNSILDIKWRLEELGYAMVYRYHKGWYRIYAGPFDRKNSAQTALQKIRKTITADARLIGESPVTTQGGSEKKAPISQAVMERRIQLQPSQRISMTYKPAPIVISRHGVIRQTEAAPAPKAAVKPKIIPKPKAAAVRTAAPTSVPVKVSKPVTPKVSPKKLQSRPVAVNQHEPIRQPVSKRVLKAAPQPAPPPIAVNKPEKSTEPSKSDESYDFYTALSAGMASIQVTKNDTRGSVTLNEKPDERDSTYGFEVGYNFTDYLFSSVNYDKATFEDVEFDHLYLTLNYRFRPYDMIRPFIGVMAGYSQMEWERSLIDSSNNDLEGHTFYSGVQVGADYLTIGPLSLFAVYRYLFTEYETDVITFPADAVLTHDQEQSFNFGLRYSF